METCVLPPKAEIKKAIVEFLRSVHCATPQQINAYIKQKFGLSDETCSMLNDYENTTVFAYRMCWIRTELRKEGLIENPQKGIWQLVRNC